MSSNPAELAVIAHTSPSTTMLFHGTELGHSFILVAIVIVIVIVIVIYIGILTGCK
jgi:hypothetical protein